MSDSSGTFGFNLPILGATNQYSTNTTNYQLDLSKKEQNTVTSTYAPVTTTTSTYAPVSTSNYTYAPQVAWYSSGASLSSKTGLSTSSYPAVSTTSNPSINPSVTPTMSTGGQSASQTPSTSQLGFESGGIFIVAALGLGAFFLLYGAAK